MSQGPGRHPVVAGRTADGRRGLVLVAVLVVVTLLSMIAVSLMFRTRAEMLMSSATAGGEKATAAAFSGLDAAIALLQQQRQDTNAWFDNPDVFREQLVDQQDGERWFFTVFATDPDDPDRLRFGVSDEAGRINVNTADQRTLAALPQMTSQRVDSLMDYRDPDGMARPGGAEQDYYDVQPEPYLMRNGWLSTVEELLLVRGFDGQVVFGEDANLDGRLGPAEDDGDLRFPPDDGDGQLRPGLAALTTVWSSEPNRDRAGRRRFNLNYTEVTVQGLGTVSQEQALEDLGLPESAVAFIDMYRDDRKRFTHASELLGMRHSRVDVLDGTPETVEVESGIEVEDMRLVMDRLTHHGRFRDFGLVNLNTAPAAVLAALPGMDLSLAQQIVAVRRTLDSDKLSSVAWPLELGLLDASTFKEVAPWLTARSFQYRVRVIGYGRPSGRYRIMEAVVDFSTRSPRILYIRDLSRLGLAFPLDQDRPGSVPMAR